MHRIVVNLETGEIDQVEYTAEEQVEYDAAKIINDEQARLAQETKSSEQ